MPVNTTSRGMTSAVAVLAAVLIGISALSGATAPLAQEPDPFSVLPARGKFLVATRNIIDPRFQETVVLLIDYSPKGAAGLIINRPTSVPLLDLLPTVPGLKKQIIVHYGGPVETYRLLLLIRSKVRPAESAPVFKDVYVSASKNTLEHLAGADKSGRRFRIYSGYAGWSSGQLEREISRGDWIVVLADAQSVFEKKSTEIWNELFQRGPDIQVWDRPDPYFTSALAETPY